MITLDPADPRLTWHNVAEWSCQKHGARPQRAPEQWRSKFDECTAWRMLQAAGMKVTFRTNSHNVILHWWQEDDAMADKGEAYCNGVLVGEFTTGVARHEIVSHFTSIEDGPADWEIILPWSIAMEIGSIQLDDGSSIEEYSPAPKQKMLCYGDSITQGFCVSRASMSWPCMVAKGLEWDTLNMGLGGAAFCTFEEGQYITSRNDWSALTIAAGINTAGTGRETSLAFRDTYAAFLSVIRESHPTDPILCITPMFYIPEADDSWRNEVGEQIPGYRDAIESAVSERIQLGDSNTHLMNGLSIIDSDSYLADDVHPHDNGMIHMSEQIVRRWKEIGISHTYV